MSITFVAALFVFDMHSIIPSSDSDVKPNTNSVSKNSPYESAGNSGAGDSTCRNFAFHGVVTGLVLGGFVNSVIVKVQV